MVGFANGWKQKKILNFYLTYRKIILKWIIFLNVIAKARNRRRILRALSFVNDR